jgi:hypothetical protein
MALTSMTKNTKNKYGRGATKREQGRGVTWNEKKGKMTKKKH